MTATNILVLCAVALLALPIVEWALLRMTAKDRDKMVDLANRMARSDKYSDDQKDMISDMLDTAMDRSFMVKITVALPALIWSRIAEKQHSATIVFDDDFRAFIRHHQRSVTAANPAFALIFRIEIALFSVLFGFALTGIVVGLVVAKIARRDSADLNSHRIA